MKFLGEEVTDFTGGCNTTDDEERQYRSGAGNVWQ